MSQFNLSTWQTKFDQLLTQLHAAFINEVTPAFIELIEQYDDLYSLALYHNGDYQGYVVISAATHSGMEEAAEHDMFAKLLPKDERKNAIKWSACDSDLHDLSTTYPLSDCNAILTEIEAHTTQHYNEFDDIEAITEQMWLVKDCYFAALNQIKIAKPIQSYQQNGGWITCTAGDIDMDELEDDLITLNGQTAFDRYIDEETHAAELIDSASDLLNQQAEQPVNIGLTLADFADLIDDFNPQFVRYQQTVLLKGPAIFKSEYDAPAQAEHNSIDYFELIGKHKHGQAFKDAYAHFSGPQHKEGELPEQILDALARKLYQALIAFDSEYQGVISFNLNRLASNFLTFCQYSENGYFPGYGSKFSDDGVQRFYLIDERPKKVAIYVQTGKFDEQLPPPYRGYFASANTCNHMQILTDKVNGFGNQFIVTSDNSEQEAFALLNEALLDQFKLAKEQKLFDFSGFPVPYDLNEQDWQVLEYEIDLLSYQQCVQLKP